MKLKDILKSIPCRMISHSLEKSEFSYVITGDISLNEIRKRLSGVASVEFSLNDNLELKVFHARLLPEYLNGNVDKYIKGKFKIKQILEGVIERTYIIENYSEETSIIDLNRELIKYDFYIKSFTIKENVSYLVIERIIDNEDKIKAILKTTEYKQTNFYLGTGEIFETYIVRKDNIRTSQKDLIKLINIIKEYFNIIRSEEKSHIYFKLKEL